MKTNEQPTIYIESTTTGIFSVNCVRTRPVKSLKANHNGGDQFNYRDSSMTISTCKNCLQSRRISNPKYNPENLKIGKS